jgi:hypothetical protein
MDPNKTESVSKITFMNPSKAIERIASIIQIMEWKPGSSTWGIANRVMGSLETPKQLLN